MPSEWTISMEEKAILLLENVNKKIKKFRQLINE